ncbi:MAG: hypothetical protein IJ530_06785 [Treponema sp.]|uniref:hypothetical protein n=1 Tax=Treponema sp. TaxID=166 RepID=UPI0025DD048E|nr:hypothetical protein [Treponema sp.]MBQ8679452.1 hypothetical protein [Treponema sp.]
MLTKYEKKREFYFYGPPDSEKENVLKSMFSKRGRGEHLPRELYGHCAYGDGAYFFSWETVEDEDFVVVTSNTNLSRREFRILKKFAKLQNRKLYINFHCPPRGLGTSILTFVLTNVSVGMLQEIGKDLYKLLKDNFWTGISYTEKGKDATLELFADDEDFPIQTIELKDAANAKGQLMKNILADKLKPRNIIRYGVNGEIIKESLSPTIDIEA